MPVCPKKRLVVVGNGMVGMRTVDQLLARAPSRYDITVFGAEPCPNYNRILLSSVLAGEKASQEIVTHTFSWYAQHSIDLIADDPVVAIDRAAKAVVSASGVVVPFDRLLIATGSKPLAPPLPGLDLPGVSTFRDIADVERMIAVAGNGRPAIVIGGGLLGLEAAWGLKRRGMDVVVVHLMSTLMERQLDAPAALLLQRDLEKRGIVVLTNSVTEEILGRKHAEGVGLADGRELAADLIVLAIGIRPNVDLAVVTTKVVMGIWQGSLLERV